MDVLYKIRSHFTETSPLSGGSTHGPLKEGGGKRDKHPCYSPRFVIINTSELPPEQPRAQSEPCSEALPLFDIHEFPVLPVTTMEFIPRCSELPVSPELPVFEGHHKFLFAKYRSKDWQLVPPKRSRENEGFGKRHCALLWWNNQAPLVHWP